MSDEKVTSEQVDPESLDLLREAASRSDKIMTALCSMGYDPGPCTALALAKLIRVCIHGEAMQQGDYWAARKAMTELVHLVLDGEEELCARSAPKIFEGEKAR